MNESARVIPIHDYDLTATLSSGQAFRWRRDGRAWTGIIGPHWVRLDAKKNSFVATTSRPVENWHWLTHYLQVELDLSIIIAGFPDDEAMCSAVSACRGLRLLRQEPWECLASFILSSTKQIVQIQQIIALLCERFGETIPTPIGHAPAFSFPTPERLANTTELDLRNCKMGFRAPYLLSAARAISAAEIDLAQIQHLPLAEARNELLKLEGVGPKIADCVLLFAYGFPDAFPVDVWVMKALRQLYFPRRRPSKARLQRFTENYFGLHAGYAQQYLFHYMRTVRSQPDQSRG